MAVSKSETQARLIADQLKKDGWVHVPDSEIFRIEKRIRPENNEDFCRADSEYYSLLSMMPGRGGSIWGTDGGGVGAITALRTGRFTMNKSGASKRVLAALNKITLEN